MTAAEIRERIAKLEAVTEARGATANEARIAREKAAELRKQVKDDGYFKPHPNQVPPNWFEFTFTQGGFWRFGGLNGAPRQERPDREVVTELLRENARLKNQIASLESMLTLHSQTDAAWKEFRKHIRETLERIRNHAQGR